MLRLDRALGRRELRAGLHGVDAGQQLAGLHAVALLHGQRDDLAHHVGADVGVARRDDLAGRRHLDRNTGARRDGFRRDLDRAAAVARGRPRRWRRRRPGRRPPARFSNGIASHWATPGSSSRGAERFAQPTIDAVPAQSAPVLQHCGTPSADGSAATFPLCDATDSLRR